MPGMIGVVFDGPDPPDDDTGDVPDPDDEVAGPPSWRRWLAVVTALAVLAVPAWNVVDGLQPQFADNGLEVCSFDYCQVEELVDDAGLGLVMARLTQERLGDDEAQAYADRLGDVVGGPAVTVEVLDTVPGDIGGRYIADQLLIQVERPATRWIVIHEVAHTVGDDHGPVFEQALLRLARWADEG